MENNREIKFKNLLSYGVGDIYGGGSFMIIGTLFLFFLTDTVGLPPWIAALVMVPGKFWDAISDPLMGYISDNIHTRFGRRRIFFLLGILPVALSYILMWVTFRSANPWISFTYYAFVFIFFRTAFTMVMVPYSALNAEMTLDYKVRMKLSGYRMFFSQLSALICAVVPKLLIDNFFSDNIVQGYLVMSIIFGIFFALPFIVVYLGTWELPELMEHSTAEKNFLKNAGTLFKNRSFKVHMGMYILSYAAMDIIMAIFVYYISYYLDKEHLFPYCMLALLLSQVLALSFYVYIGNKKGKGFAYRLGLAIWGSAMISTYFLTPEMPSYVIILISIWIGSGLSAGTMIPWAILPSVTDVDEMITGKQRAGTYAGAMTFIRKIVNALTILIIGILLEIVGFIQPVREIIDGRSQMVKQPQTLETIYHLKLILFLVPLIFIIIGIIWAFKYKITPKTHEILKNELKRLKDGGSKDDVSEESREICELLTGVDYKDLYGTN